MLIALLGLVNGHDTENELRFEAIEPLVAQSTSDLTINLFVSIFNEKLKRKGFFCKSRVFPKNEYEPFTIAKFTSSKYLIA